MVLAGCTLPDVSMSPSVTHAAGRSTAEATRSSATPSVAARPAAATVTRKSGDLDSGTTTHSLPAGDRTVVITYWTTQDAKTWGPASVKPIQISAHVEGGNLKQEIQVTRFLATADDGHNRTTASEDSGQFVITPPFSYSTALSLPASSASATSLTLYVELDMLVETGAKTGEFFRQTVLDSLSLPLVPEVSQ